MNKKGFTLVEILGTMVILGILSVVAIIAYSRYKEKALIQAYDTMAKSSSLGLEQVRLTRGNVSSMDLQSLYDNNFISSITDPATKGKCEGTVYAMRRSVNSEMLVNDEYLVNLCCNNYYYTYTFPGGTKEETDTCHKDDEYDTTAPKIEDLVVTSSTPNYNNKVVNISFNAVDVDGVLGEEGEHVGDLFMCISTSFKCDNYVNYDQTSQFVIDGDYDGSKKVINVFLKDADGNLDFESKEYRLYKECDSNVYYKAGGDGFVETEPCSGSCGESGTIQYERQLFDLITEKKCGNPETKSTSCTGSCIVYDITFDGNGGKIDGESSITKKLSENTVLGSYVPTATRSKYTFLGWNTNPDGTGTNVDSSTVLTSNLTVYAVWRLNKLYIKYYTTNINGTHAVSSCTNSNSPYKLKANGSGYLIEYKSPSNYVLSSDSTVVNSLEYGSSFTPPSYENPDNICLQSDYYVGRVEPSGEETTGYATVWGNGSYTYISGTSYDAATIASNSSCDLSKGDCPVTMNLVWRKTRGKFKYDCNGGKIVQNSDKSVPKDWLGRTGICYITSWHEWSGDLFKKSGLRDHDPDTNSASLPMKKGNKKGTRYYKVGKFKIHERNCYSTIYKLLKAIQDGGGPNLVDQIKKDDIVVSFVATYES